MVIVGFTIKILKDNLVLCCEHAFKENFILPKKSKIVVSIVEGKIPEKEVFIPVTDVKKTSLINVFKGTFAPRKFLEYMISVISQYEERLKALQKYDKIPEKYVTPLSHVDNLINLLFYNSGYFNLFMNDNDTVKVIKTTYKRLVERKEFITFESEQNNLRRENHVQSRSAG